MADGIVKSSYSALSPNYRWPGAIAYASARAYATSCLHRRLADVTAPGFLASLLLGTGASSFRERHRRFVYHSEASDAYAHFANELDYVDARTNTNLHAPVADVSRVLGHLDAFDECMTRNTRQGIDYPCLPVHWRTDRRYRVPRQ